LHGRPRFTQDIDLVIGPSRSQLEGLVDALEADFTINRDAAREAHTRHGEFNAIHRTVVFKVDFWLSTGDAFDASRLARATMVELMPGLAARVATAEDAIISKLRWLRQGATGRSTEDIQGILRAHAGTLDLDYLDGMARTLGLDQLWAPLRPRA
jgi:hypothetical protein